MKKLRLDAISLRMRKLLGGVSLAPRVLYDHDQLSVEDVMRDGNAVQKIYVAAYAAKAKMEKMARVAGERAKALRRAKWRSIRRRRFT